MNRKQRRALKKQTDQKTTDTIELMLNIPNECLLCKKNYDKKDREMVKTWFVEVYNKEKKVNLYCPECNEARKNAQ